MHYLVSFVGYFPADEPRYSCIVCLQKAGLPASGGTMSGWVFHNISEGIMAHSLNMDITHARDTASNPLPQVLNGNLESASIVLDHLGYSTHHNWANAKGNFPFWGDISMNSNKFLLNQTDQGEEGTVPNVVGMGARDAVYLMEKRGVNTILKGRGKVVQQSIHPGAKASHGTTCVLTLQYL